MSSQIERNTELNSPSQAQRQTTATRFTLSWAERLESLKAGLLGAIAASLMFGLMTGLQIWLASQFAVLTGWPTLDWKRLIGGAIAALSGFLFAVTYRYIIRQDQNSHLKSGAVAAFGLVRGLAQLDVGFQAQVMPLVLPLLVLESMILFAGVQTVLDWAIAQGLITSFPAVSQD